MSNDRSIDRRSFLKTAAAAGAGVALAGCLNGQDGRGRSNPLSGPVSAVGLTAPPMQHIRIGLVGCGGRGRGLLRHFLAIDGAGVTAVCDIKPDRAARAQEMVEKAGQTKAPAFTSGETDYKRLVARDDVDLVINATPWDWHVPICMDAMNAGKHVGVEVPAAMTVEGCWKLVETAERTQKHCMMLENCCYGEAEMMVLNMCRQGLFGELLHGECAYIHDLRGLKFDTQSEGEWRLEPSIRYDGNLYPTHGLGPIAQYMNINRGDRFDYLVSMSSPARGIKLYAKEKFGPDDPRARQDYRLGDMNTSLIKTARGLTIMLQHDTTTPRPYSRINMIQGTRGMFAGYPSRLTFGHEWEDLAPYEQKYQHPLWKKVGEVARQSGGHGGMDFVMCWRLIDCLKRGLPLDQDVYDAAAWSCIVELSIKSVANRSAALDIPDFTRGAWKTTAPLGIVQ